MVPEIEDARSIFPRLPVALETFGEEIPVSHPRCRVEGEMRLEPKLGQSHLSTSSELLLWSHPLLILFPRVF